jgi:CheY-like chemotaxis protein
MPLQPPCVLVVDDDDALRGEIAELLALGGYRVREAGDGASALELLRAPDGVDVVLLDLWMPTMDGWTFRVRQLEDPSIRHVPVVILSADDAPQARAVHAEAFLQKPFDADALSSTVRRVVTAHRARLDTSAALVSKTVALMAGAVSHEVANPLMVLITWLEQQRRTGRLSSERGAAATDIDDMLAHCWRMADTVRSIRSLPYPAESRESSVDLCRMIRTAIARVPHPERFELPEVDEVLVFGQPFVILYACATVLQHALETEPVAGEATPEPPVTVRILRREGRAVVEVEDSGPPIAEDDLTSVFTFDYTGRASAWSAGLRLWYVRHALEGLGGSIEMENRARDGVRCRFSLPLA